MKRNVVDIKTQIISVDSLFLQKDVFRDVKKRTHVLRIQ